MTAKEATTAWNHLILVRRSSVCVTLENACRRKLPEYQTYLEGHPDQESAKNAHAAANVLESWANAMRGYALSLEENENG
jgi:hypothetical protein